MDPIQWEWGQHRPHRMVFVVPHTTLLGEFQAPVEDFLDPDLVVEDRLEQELHLDSDLQEDANVVLWFLITGETTFLLPSLYCKLIWLRS